MPYIIYTFIFKYYTNSSRSRSSLTVLMHDAPPSRRKLIDIGATFFTRSEIIMALHLDWLITRPLSFALDCTWRSASSADEIASARMQPDEMTVTSSA